MSKNIYKYLLNQYSYQIIEIYLYKHSLVLNMTKSHLVKILIKQTI